MVARKRKDGRDFVVPPKLVDGKWLKECECGCGVIIEVSAKARGNQKYSTECGKRIHREQQRVKADKKNWITCRKCGVRKPPKEFLPGQEKNKLIHTCKDCMPFSLSWANKMPECGKYGRDDVWPDGFTEKDTTCKAYTECQARIAAGYWLPCTVPDRSELVKFVFSTPEERKYIRSIIQHRFDSAGRLIGDDIERYLNYYYDLGAKYESEAENEKSDSVKISVPVSGVYINM